MGGDLEKIVYSVDVDRQRAVGWKRTYRHADEHKRAFNGVDRQEWMPMEWAFMSGIKRK